jgi:hypothetical protein
MRTNTSINGQVLMHRLVNLIFNPLFIIFFLLPYNISHALVPDSADIVDFEGGVTVNRRSAKIGEGMKYKDELIVPASFNDNNFADLDLKQRSTKLSIRAVANGKRDTTYTFPCQIAASPNATVQIAWSNGKKGACGEGIRATNPKSRNNSRLPKFQPIQIAQAKNLEKNRLFLNALNESNLRYYCSSVPDSGKGSGKISAGLTSIEDACQQSQEVCESKNNNGCSIATMGEWDLNDSDLMMAVTCNDGKSLPKRVSGSEIIAPGSSFEDLVRKLSKELGLDSLDSIITSFLGTKACYLEVYSPDEVLISPDNNQQTIVQTTGLEGNKIRVDVKEGEVRLRSSSTKDPYGVIAKQGDSYIFNRENGEGSIDPDKGGNTPPDSGSSTSPPSDPNSPSPDSPSPSSPSSPSSSYPDTSPSPSSTP